MMTVDEWVSQLCEALGVEQPDVRAVLDLTGDVAHRVNRPAAPVTALIVGLAAASASDLPSVMEQVRKLLPAEDAAGR